MTTSNPLSAQGVFLGGGATFPVSDYGDYANTGYLLIAGGGRPVGDSGLGVGLEAFYGRDISSTTAPREGRRSRRSTRAWTVV
jgi:hypothetical protein